MSELVRKQRHFVLLFTQTTTKQRKVLLDTITVDQLKAISQIAHNIIKTVLVLTLTEKETLKKRKRLIHLLGNKRAGFKRKKKALVGNQRSVLALLKVALPHLQQVLR